MCRRLEQRSRDAPRRDLRRGQSPVHGERPGRHDLTVYAQNLGSRTGAARGRPRAPALASRTHLRRATLGAMAEWEEEQ